MIKYQIYSHYKLPITTDPLKFGKLLDQTNNKFIIQLTTKNIAVINHYDKENFVRIFKNGDLVLEFRDKLISESSFIRTLNDTKFLFENDKLISTQILSASGSTTIFDAITPLSYSDTDALITNYRTWLENTYIFKNKKAELFILFELFLIFSIFIICFVIFPDESNTTISIVGLSGNLKNKLNWTDINLETKNTNFSSKLLKSKLDIFWKEIMENKLKSTYLIAI